ncbi:MFS transporter [Pseudomonas matsuisoli]|uniref:MFS transporter n=2 Tax=Pseudomonas matsuisoli TaxID=1515666 RepID=A0A917UUT9_9PSED|nr:MFS transporter [Pseudomonas matsuisoli]
MPLSSARRQGFGRDYLALGLMYFAQGLPTGLAFDALPVLIREGGHGMAQIGWVGLAFLPWALKFLWASPIDNACRRWGIARVIYVTQGLLALACLALMPFAPGTHLGFALAGVVGLNLICATQDIATNAYAVSRLQGRAAGPANAMQVAGFILGMLTGGGGFLMLYPHLGWSGLMLLMAIGMPLLFLPLLLRRDWHSDDPLTRAGKVRLLGVLQHRDLLFALGIAVSFKFASTAVATLTKSWLIDQGLDVSQAGSLQVSNLLLMALGGVLVGIPLVRRTGNRRAVLITGALATLLLGTAWLLDAGGVQDVRAYYAGFGLQAIFEGSFYVSVWALFMNWASHERPGTDYSAMQCCESLTNMVGASIVGGLGQAFGYSNVFASAWVAGAMAWLLIAFCLRRLQLAGEAG